MRHCRSVARAPKLTGMNTAPATATTTGLLASELHEFRSRGFVVRRGLFPVEQLDRLRTEIDGLHEAMAKRYALGTEHPGGEDHPQVSWEEGQASGRPPRIRQLMNSEVVSPILDAMSRDERLLAIIRDLIGADAMLFHSKLMMKAAHDGAFTPWHQDFGYWVHESRQPTQVNCMLAIDAADAENGALRFVDGTQNDGLITHQNFASTSFNWGLPGDIDSKPSTMESMAPGDAVFFGPMVVHGSAPNRSARDRRANTFAFDISNHQLGDQLSPKRWRCGRKV